MHKLPSVLGDRLLHALLSHVSDCLIHAVVECAQPLDASRLERAVALSFAAEPILGCRMIEGFWRMRWQTQDAAALSAAFSVQSSDAPEDAVERFMVRPAFPDRDPLAQVCLIRGERDFLCVKVQHIAADAGAVKQYLYRLAAIYRKLTDDPAYRPQPNPGKRGLGPLVRQLSLRDLPGMLRRGRRNLRSTLSPRRNWTLPLVNATEPRFFPYRRLDQPTFRRVKAFARRHGATINDLALTATLRSFERLARRPPNTPRRLVCTVDLRRYLAPQDEVGICNLSAFCYLNLGQYLDGGFADTLIRVRDEMRMQKADYLGLGDLPSWLLLMGPMPFGPIKGLIKRAFDPNRTDLPPGMTNMGALEPDRLLFDNHPPRHAWAAAPVMFPGLTVVGVSGYRDTLTFSLGGCGGEENRQLIERLLDGILAELQRAAEGGDGVA